jgi:TPR repeat protein
MKKQPYSAAHAVPSVLVGCVLALGGGDCALANNEFEKALAAYEQGRYRTAFSLVKVSAERGGVQAQHILGVMYRRGLGVPEDEYAAFDWCRRAAENGLLEAQFQLGLMYLEGEGVTEDHDEAQKWLWAAADRGYPQASEVLQFIFSRDFAVGC